VIQFVHFLKLSGWSSEGSPEGSPQGSHASLAFCPVWLIPLDVSVVELSMQPRMWSQINVLPRWYCAVLCNLCLHTMKSISLKWIIICRPLHASTIVAAVTRRPRVDIRTSVSTNFLHKNDGIRDKWHHLSLQIIANLLDWHYDKERPTGWGHRDRAKDSMLCHDNTWQRASRYTQPNLL